MPPIQLTNEQEEVIRFLQEEKDRDLVVNAYAGSAKTTTLVTAVNVLPESLKIISCAFNKRIANELQDRMPANCQAATLNAIGHRTWRDHIGEWPKVDKFKTWKMADRLGVPKGTFPDLPRLVSLAKARGIVPEGSQNVRGLLADEITVWQDLIEDHELEVGQCQNPIDLARETLRLSIKEAWNGNIDFDDQLYMPVVAKAAFPQADLVMVDEAQDISSIQRVMLRRMSMSGRFVAVGDSHQAIYAFRGADYTSIERILHEWKADTRTLSISFRCPKAVILEAQRWVAGIRSWDQAREGSVGILQSYEPSTFPKGSAILCRNTRPLVSLALKLISAHVGAVVLGRDLAENLQGLAKKSNASKMSAFYDGISKYASQKVAALAAKGKEGQIESLNDRVDALLAIAESLPANAPLRDLLNTIDRMFSNTAGPVTLSTIHKAKGLEWEHVYFLDSWLIPSRYAKTPPQVQQENNLSYVAVTRSKDQLTYIDSKGLRARGSQKGGG